MLVITGCCNNTHEEIFTISYPTYDLDVTSSLSAEDVRSDVLCAALCLCSTKCVAVVVQYLMQTVTCTLLPKIMYTDTQSSLNGNLYI